ncbi:hypothetical protein MKX01_010055 [Papaver californicum]|nr:hypothetical protein MKX01_010055 [Papaver californicum]
MNTHLTVIGEKNVSVHSLYLISVILIDVSAQTFAETCQKNGGIDKGVKEVGTCDVGFKTPCPQTNPVMKNGVCTVRSPYSTAITCSCCCVNYQ